MQPRARGRTDPLLHDVDEGGDVVLRRLLPFEDGVDVEAGSLADGGRVGSGHDSQLGPGLGRKDLDLEPRTEASFVGEQLSDLGKGVAVYQAGGSSCRTLYEPG